MLVNDSEYLTLLVGVKCGTDEQEIDAVNFLRVVFGVESATQLKKMHPLP